MNKELVHGGLRIGFSPDLAFFLAKGQENPACCDGLRRASVKDIVESLGVPHTEVGRIRFEGVDVGFDFIPQIPGLVQVSGIDAPFDVLSGSLLRPSPLSFLSFVADLNVIKLGRYLMFLGYDVILARELPDSGIADLSAGEGRIVLTRDTRLLFRKKVCFARRIRSVHPLDQLAETISFFGLSPDPALFFSRCVRCNLQLEPVAKDKIFHLLEPKTQRYVHEFRRCPGCGQIFWEGSHFKALEHKFRLQGILN